MKKKIFIFLYLLIIIYDGGSILKNNQINHIRKDYDWNILKVDNLYKLKSLQNMPKDINKSLILKEKDEFLVKISKHFKKKINSINIIYLKSENKLGNLLLSLNNAIFTCEIIGCKKILLGNGTEFYIKHKIFYPKYNMSIEPFYQNIINSNNTLIFSSHFFFYHRQHYNPENRFYVIKAEILNNLPKVETNPKDLYIHIRSGDIFDNEINIGYSQPPLCFYQKIIREFKFRKIYIISKYRNNPNINLLLKEFDYIIYNKNNKDLDISYLVNAYNIVASTSSFLITLIKFNDKLKFLWEFDLYRLSNRILHMHHSFSNFSFNYTIYKMVPSERYIKIMSNWYNSLLQKRFMIKEKCKNTFSIIKPRS